MKYIVLEEPGKLRQGDKDPPVLRIGEALIKISKVGICGTDLHAYAGNQAFFTYPRILGHELAGEVVETEGKPTSLKKGDQVIPMPYLHCGQCVACRNEQTNCCENLKVMGVHSDGGMQEYIVVPHDLLLPSRNLTTEEMAIVEPLAIGAHALSRAGVNSHHKIVVVGGGPIGLGIAKQAEAIGAQVILLDTSPTRLEFSKRVMGVNHSFIVDDQVLDQIREITHNELADVVFDATGNRRALESGVRYMRSGGTYVLVGLYSGDLTFSHPEIHKRETSLLCSRNATRKDFLDVIDYLKSKKFPTSQYITHQVGPEDLVADFKKWLDPKTGVMKAMMTF